MVLSEELNALHELHAKGGLNDEEYARAKQRLIDGGGATAQGAVAALNALRRSSADRWLAGVCGGLARATGAEAWIWRLAFVAFALWGGVGLLLYVLLWIFVPSD